MRTCWWHLQVQQPSLSDRLSLPSKLIFLERKCWCTLGDCWTCLLLPSTPSETPRALTQSPCSLPSTRTSTSLESYYPPSGCWTLPPELLSPFGVSLSGQLFSNGFFLPWKVAHSSHSALFLWDLVSSQRRSTWSGSLRTSTRDWRVSLDNLMMIVCLHRSLPQMMNYTV